MLRIESSRRDDSPSPSRFSTAEDIRIFPVRYNSVLCPTSQRTKPVSSRLPSRLPSPSKQTQPTSHPSPAHQTPALRLPAIHKFAVAVACSPCHLGLTSTRFGRRCLPSRLRRRLRHGACYCPLSQRHATPQYTFPRLLHLLACNLRAS